MDGPVQGTFAFNDWTEIREANKRGARDEISTEPLYQECILRIFRSYKQKWGAGVGLSDRELDLAQALAHYMVETRTTKQPVWWLDDYGISCCGLHMPRKRRSEGTLPLLRDLDRLMDPDYREDEE